VDKASDSTIDQRGHEPGEDRPDAEVVEGGRHQCDPRIVDGVHVATPACSRRDAESRRRRHAHAESLASGEARL